MNWRNQNKRLILFLLRNGMEMELNGLLPFHSLISSMVSGCWLCLLGPSNSSPFPLPFLFYCEMKSKTSVAKQKKRMRIDWREVWLNGEVGRKPHNPPRRIMKSETLQWSRQLSINQQQTSFNQFKRKLNFSFSLLSFHLSLINGMEGIEKVL